MVEHAVTRFGGLHIAVNNAGINDTPYDEFENIDIADWLRVIDTNVNAVFRAMKAEVPALRKSGGTAIVNTASAAAVAAVPGKAPYVTSSMPLPDLRGRPRSTSSATASGSTPSHLALPRPDDRERWRRIGLAGCDQGYDARRQVRDSGGDGIRDIISGIGRSELRRRIADDCGWGAFGRLIVHA